MALNLRQIVKKLRAEGNRVTYHRRKDGSIRVTSINGIKFDSRFSQGNEYARQLAGERLSERQTAQRERQRREIAKRQAMTRKPRTVKAALSKEVKKALRQAQRRIRKAAPESKGTVTAQKVREYLKEHTEDDVIAKLDRVARYFEGYAYEENVLLLAGRCEMVGAQLQSDKLRMLAEHIRGMVYEFREAWIHPCYEILYEAEVTGRTASPSERERIGETAAASISQIIGL